MVIDDDVWVTVRYRLFDSQGDALEPSERELTYLHGGYGSVFQRIEQALAGHGKGFATSVYLEPEDSFGDYDPELVRLAPRSQFPSDLEVGMTFEGVPGEEGDEDEGLIYIVTDIGGEAVVLDANHPLAGMSLRFDLRVVDLRAASAEEVAQERDLAAAAAGGQGGAPLRRPAAGEDEEFDDDEFDEPDAQRSGDRPALPADDDDEGEEDDDEGEDREGDAPPRRLH